MRVLVLLGLVGAAVGCGWAGEAFLEAPDTAGIETLVLAQETAEAGWALEVHRAGEPIRYRSTGSGSRVVLLGYREPPAELGLGLGRLAGATTTCERKCDLLHPAAVHLAPGDVGSLWTQLSPLPDALSLSLVPDPARCPRHCLFPAPFELVPLPEMSTAVLPDSPGSVLIINGSGLTERLFVDDRPREPICRVDLPFAIRAALRGDDGRVLVAGAGAGVFAPTSTTAGGRCAVSMLPAPPAELRALGGSPALLAGELYGLTVEGALVRFDGAAWREVLRLGSPPSQDDLFDGAEVLWIGPGRVAATFSAPAILQLYPDGRRELETVMVDGVAERLRAPLMSSFGLVLAMDDLGLVLQRGNSWVRLPSPRTARVGSIVEALGRLIATEYAGSIEEVHVEELECPSGPRVGRAVARRVRVVGDRHLVLGDPTAPGDPPRAAIVELLPACGAPLPPQ
ncbi:MAG: hypothetical protein IT384_10065 [Deltaproteobacteria bacterium]|nr:hypothetical protein [Deltaproteobacteria bacterium]